jgi:hypothetical protein
VKGGKARVYTAVERAGSSSGNFVSLSSAGDALSREARKNDVNLESFTCTFIPYWIRLIPCCLGTDSCPAHEFKSSRCLFKKFDKGTLPYGSQ